MKPTLALMGVTIAAKAAAIAQFLSDYSGTLAGAAACVTMIAGVWSMVKKGPK